MPPGWGMRFIYASIPFTSSARRYAQDWVFPGGSSDNRLYYRFPRRFC